MLTQFPRAIRTFFVSSVVLLILSVILSASNVTAALSAPLASRVTVPNEVGLEGFLTDGSGQPMADDDYDLTFSVYSVAIGGSAIYSETQTISTVDGLYTAMIGSVEPLPTNLFDGDRWIGVTVESDPELTPRTQVGSVPFALNAEHAN